MAEDIGMAPLSTKDANELRRLCHEGMLFEVEVWIRTGKSVLTGGAPDRSPLAITAGKGFHSLVKLLLAQEPCQDILDAAMAKAANGDGVETLKLLFEAGATLKDLTVVDVVSKASPDVIEALVRHGLDVGHDDALGWAMYNEYGAATEYFRKYHRRHARVRDQGAKALVYAVRRDKEHVASRLKKAGADPRRRVVPLYARKYDHRYGETALEAAALDASFKIFLLMGPRKSDDLADLLRSCCLDFDLAKIKMLLKRGAVVNDREDGGSSLLQKCLTSLSMGEYHRSLHYRAVSDRAWELTNALVTEYGAKWNPSPEDLRMVRIWLKYGDPRRMYALAVLLVENDVTPRELVRKLYDTRRFRQKLGEYWPDVRTLVGMRPRR